MKTKQLPQGWKEVELGELIKLRGGFAFKSVEFVKEGVPLVRISNFNNNEVDLNDAVFVPFEEYEKYPELQLKENDLLIAMSGATTGKVGIISKKNIPCLLNQRVGKFEILNKNITWRYLYLFIKSKKFQNKVLSIAGGCAQPNISGKQIESITLPLPPQYIQEQIVSILEKAEQLKEKRKKSIEVLDEYLKSVFSEMFLKKKFEIKKLGEIARLDMGGTPNTQIKDYWENGNVNWMKSGDIKGDYIEEIKNKITEEGLKNSNAKIYEKGDIVMALNGQGKTRGTTAILGIKTSSNQSVASIRSDYKIVNSEYIHFNLKHRYSELRNLTGDNQRSGLNLTILRNLKIPLPPIPLQKEFASIVKHVEKLKENQKKSQEEIEHLFNALMQKAFQGELI